MAGWLNSIRGPPHGGRCIADVVTQADPIRQVYVTGEAELHGLTCSFYIDKLLPIEISNAVPDIQAVQNATPLSPPSSYYY